jgi:high affinity sulfate transporter 1
MGVDLRHATIPLGARSNAADPSPDLPGPGTVTVDGVGHDRATLRERIAIRRAVRRYVPIVGWLSTYDRRDLRFDAISGIASWGVMVPVAMAYAGLAGMPPETGLVTAFAALAAYAVFGTSRHLKVTASSSVAIMSASVVGALAAGDASDYVALSSGLALIVGAILIVAGAARLGFLSQFLAASVVTGFVIGLAVVITIGQIPALLGIPAVGGTIIQKVVAIGESLDELNRYTAALGIATVIGIVILRRLAPRVPGALVALIIGIALSTLLDLPAKGVAVVGDVTTGVPLPGVPRIPFGDVVFLTAGAFGIVFLALAESIGAARSFAVRHGYDIDPDQELIALGVSNAATGLFGGFAVDASLSQSATGEAAGNRTQLASLITAGLVLATAVILAPIFKNLPLSVLAAIVITSVLGLVNIAELRRYLAWKRTDFLLAMTALAGVIFTTALTGMAIAVALSLLAILYQASRPYIAVLGRIPTDPPVYADAERHPTAEPVEGFLIVRPNVPLTFVNADVAKDQIMALIRGRPVAPGVVVLDIAATADLDVATTDMLSSLLTDVHDSGTELRLAQVRGSVRDRMRRTGLMTVIGEERCYYSVEAAVAAPTVATPTEPTPAGSSAAEPPLTEPD